MATQTAAPGFVGLEELFAQRVTDVGWTIVNDAVALSAQLHTQELDAALKTFVMEVDKPKMRFKQPVVTELQPLEGADDNPIPVSGYDQYDVAFPLRSAGYAWGTNRISRALMTVEEANNQTLIGLMADKSWMRRHMLAAIFESDSYTFTDPEWGNLTIMPLANGDAQQYLKYDGETYTDTHYLAQADAIDGSHNPFPTIYDELTEHPSNVGDPIVYVSSSLVASIEALSGFIEVNDPNVRPGVATTTLAGLPQTTLGDRVLGYVDRCWIVEWRVLPSGYMIAHTEGGGPFIGMRQYNVPELRGLRPEFFNADGNHYVSRLLRSAGFGVMNRIGALVYYVGGASYTTPSGYDAPRTI